MAEVVADVVVEVVKETVDHVKSWVWVVVAKSVKRSMSEMVRCWM